MIELHVTEPSPVSLRYVEAAIKPEQVKDVTPLYEPQTVLPDAGMTLSRVNVGAIPEPTEVKEISENGDYDVRRYGTARVNVQPRLQSKTVTPTKQAQAVTPDSGYYGLEEVDVDAIPPEYIVPSGSLDITENGTYDVSQYAQANVNVQDAPEVGLLFSGWDNIGRPSIVTTVGMRTIPDWFFYLLSDNRYNRGYWNSRLTTIYLNEGVETIGPYAFRECRATTHIFFPSTLVSLNGTWTFNLTPLQLMDFSKAQRVVILINVNNVEIPSGCVIRVPQALLNEWQNATNWCDLTDVVWEGV